MKQRYMKRIIAFVMAIALVVTGSGLSAVLNDAAASAASKKAKVTLKLNKTKAVIKAGKSTTLKITKKNVKKIKSQTWSTNKKSVATVSKKGKVTAKKAGKATISVKIKYIAKGKKKVQSKTLKCKVTVEAKATPTQAPAKTSAPTPTPFRFVWEDTSNIGEAQEVQIVGGTSESMIKKDNGKMRQELNSQDLVDSHMGLAINLGNTMEATLSMPIKMQYAAKDYEGVSATWFETAWGASVTTQKYIDTLHSYGINTLRIPVAWSNMDSEDTTYTINEKYLGRVEEIVNYALNDGMYVIINDHWDNGWWGQFGAAKKEPRLDADGNPKYGTDGSPLYNKVADEERRAEAWKRYERYWTQIAERFKDYSDHLIFEGANEELGKRLNDSIYRNGYGAPTDPYDTTDEALPGNLKQDEMYKITNDINQKFVEVVRNTGGNNESRFLLIPGYDTNMGYTADERFVMPTDTIAKNGKTKLLVSVHNYTPWSFCGDGGSSEYTDVDKEMMEEEYALTERFAKEGYGIIVGETGCCSPRRVDVSKRTVAQRFMDGIEAGLPYHALAVFWETGQYFDREECKLKFKDIALLFNQLTGCNGDTSMTALTGAQNNPGSIADVTGKTPVWSWSGIWYKNGNDNLVGPDRFKEDASTIGSSLADFVPESHTEATIEGDQTAIEFNGGGYQAFLKLDLSKYKRPAIKFTFSEDTLEDTEKYIGDLQLGTTSTLSYAGDLILPYDKFAGKAVAIEDEILPSAGKPILSISFSMKPTVTGIEIYELGE